MKRLKTATDLTLVHTMHTAELLVSVFHSFKAGIANAFPVSNANNINIYEK